MSNSLTEAISYIFENDYEKATQVLITVVYTFPPQIKECLKESSELLDLQEAYKIKTNDLRTLSKIVLGYLIRNQYKKSYLSGKKIITVGDTYYEFGKLIGDSILEIDPIIS